MALAALHPRRIMQALDAIDAEAPSYSLSRPAALRRVFAVLAAVCVSLLILHYSRYSTNFHALLGYLGQWRMQDAHYYLRALEASGWLELAGYAWWTGCHLLTFILIPWLVIRWLFKEKMIDFGWRWNQVGAHWRGPSLCGLRCGLAGERPGALMPAGEPWRDAPPR